MTGIRVTFHTAAQMAPGSNPDGKPLPKFTAELPIDFSMNRAMLTQLATHIDPSDVAGQNELSILQYMNRDVIVRNVINEKLQASFLKPLIDSGAINSVHVELF